jgi:Ca2+-binding RTX toxin-like protein
VTQLTVAGRFGSADANDWYALVVPQTETVNLDLSVVYGNPEISLYNNTSSQALAYAYAAQSGDAWLTEVLQPGTYYLDISALADSSYTLTAFSGALTTGSTTNSTGTNTTGATLATAIGLGTLSTTAQIVTGGLTPGRESAFYAFNVSSISSVKITIGGLSASGLIYIRNAAGQQLQVIQYTPANDGSLIDALAPLSSGSYYIDIEGYQTTATGYSLSVSATALTTSAGTSTASARAIGVVSASAQTFSDSLNPITTQEYYSFTLGAVSQLDALVSGLTSGATLTLEDALGNRITSAAGSGTNNASLLADLAPLGSGTYYIEVSEAGTATTPYTLLIKANPIPDLAGSTEAGAKNLGTLATAPVTVSDFVGSVDPADYYTFVLADATTLIATLSAYSGNNASSASLSLFNPGGTAIVSSLSANSQSNAVVDTVLQAGTYTVEVTTSAVAAPYTLNLSTGSPSVGAASVQSAGNALATATSLGTLTSTPASYAEWIGPGDTTDYFAITLAGPAKLNLQVTGLSVSNNVAVTLLGLAGNQLQAYGVSNSLIYGASLIDELAAGTYYVEVSDAGPGTGYNLSATATALPVAAGSSSATADNIGNLGTLQSFSGYVGPAETDNYYAFTLATASIVTLDLSTNAGEAVLTLRDVSGNALATQDATNSGDGIQVQPLATGTYYIDISDIYQISADYNLNVSATAISDPAGMTQATADMLGTLGNAGTIQSISGSNTIDAGSGSVTIPSGAEYVTSEGSSTIQLTAGAPTVFAATGNPLVFGNSASLTFVGGSGAATVIGGTGGNSVSGGSGSLLLFANSATTYTTGSGAATIIGGAGGLTAVLGAGGGEIFGGSGGVNSLWASNGTAALVGVGSGDILNVSGTGNDILVGGSGAETLNASQSTGNNAFFGGTGAESINGGTGNDYFLVGSGNETLSGHGGTNAYVFVAGAAPRTDTVTDFNSASDLIVLFNYGSNAPAAALSSAVVAGGGTTVTLSDGTSIILPGATHLTSANIL